MLIYTQGGQKQGSAAEHIIWEPWAADATNFSGSTGVQAQKRGKYTFDSDIHEAIELQANHNLKSTGRVACIAPPYGIIARTEAALTITLKNECPPAPVSTETNSNYSVTMTLPATGGDQIRNETRNNPSKRYGSGKNVSHQFTHFYALSVPKPVELVVQRFDTIGVEIDWDTTALESIGGYLVKSKTFNHGASDQPWQTTTTSNVAGVPSVFTNTLPGGGVTDWVFTSDYDMAFIPDKDLLMMPYYDYDKGCPAIAYIFENLASHLVSGIPTDSKDYAEINSVWRDRTVTLHVGGNDPHWNHHNYGVTQRNPGGYALYA